MADTACKRGIRYDRVGNAVPSKASVITCYLDILYSCTSQISNKILEAGIRGLFQEPVLIKAI